MTKMEDQLVIDSETCMPTMVTILGQATISE